VRSRTLAGADGPCCFAKSAAESHLQRHQQGLLFRVLVRMWQPPQPASSLLCKRAQNVWGGALGLQCSQANYCHV
jgi:hypothetical protein